MIYSQSSLRAFLDCPKFFELRYIKKVDWPGSNPVIPPTSDTKIRQGKQFHEIAHLYFSGTKADEISSWISDPELLSWWEHFQATVIPRLADKVIFSEQTLEIPIGDDKLKAIYDAISFPEDNTIEIFDWKISKKPMDIAIIPQLIQTIVYCQVMMKGYFVLQQSDTMPTNNLSMAYWYAGDANPFVNHQYTDAQAKEDHTYLSNLLQNINTCKQTGFIKTEQLDHCARCHYRSYCRQNIPQIPANEYIDIDRLYEVTRQQYEDTEDEWV